MQWYVLQTWTGKEEKLVDMIQKIVPRKLYGECFVAYHERLFRRQQRNLIHVERVFPGYVFITSDDPETLFLNLRQVPAMSKLMSDGDFTFLPIDPKEAEFLEQILDSDHIMRLSYVSTDGKNHVYHISGPLEFCRPQIVRYRFRERYAVIRLKLLGEEKDVILGIVLNEDVRRELQYGKVEAPVVVPKQYSVPAESEVGREAAAGFSIGEPVIVISGALEGMMAVIDQVKRDAVKIAVRLFGQELTIEVPFETVRKTVA